MRLRPPSGLRQLFRLFNPNNHRPPFIERFKLDALDLIVRVLMECEKTLDRLLSKMERESDLLEELVDLLEALYEPASD